MLKLPQETDPLLYSFGDFTLDDQLCQLTGPAGLIPMERRIFDLLLYMVRNRGRVISKGELVRTIWSNRVVSDASLSVAITGLRRSLGDNATSPRFVVTHNARGYRFAAIVLERNGSNDTRNIPTKSLQPDPFVGRSRELAIARGAAQAAREGRLQIVVITGEAGIGKSRLLEHISRDLQSTGYQLLPGRCPETPGAPAFWPWIQVLRHHFEALLPGELGALLCGVEDILHILPELREHVRSTPPPAPRDPSRARFRLFDAIGTCLDRAAKRIPTAITIEDLHRSDETSILLLSFLANSLPDSPLLVVVTLRDGPHQPYLEKAMGTLTRTAGATFLQLCGLAPLEVAELLATLTGESASPSAAAAFHERTEGNPYFLTQLAKHFSRLDDFSTAEFPDSLTTAIAAQIDDLSDPTKEFLLAAAVSGVDFDLPTVCEVLLLDEANASGLAEEAFRSCIVSHDSTTLKMRFRHSLLRDALYQRVNPSKRTLLHQRFAQVLASRYGKNAAHHLPRIAHHYYEGAATGVAEAAINYSLDAGKWSASCLAHEEAARFFERGLALLDLFPASRSELRCEFLIRLGDQLIKAGEREPARRAFDQAYRLAANLGASQLLADAAMAAAPGLLAIESGVVDTFLVELLDSAAALFSDSNCSTYPRLSARLSLALHWSDAHLRARDLAERAALADLSRDLEAKSNVQQALWFTRHGPSFLDERRQIAADLVAYGRESIAPETQLVSQLFWLYSLLERGDMGAFENERGKFCDLAENLKQPQALWYVGMLDGMSALLRGDFAAGALHAERFAALGRRINDANAVHSHLAHSALITYELGDIRIAIPFAQNMASRFPSVFVWRAAVAWMLALSGDAVGSSNEVRRLVRELPSIPVRMDWSGAIAILGETASLIRDERSAQALYQALVPLQDSYVILGICTLFWGSADRVLGLLSNCMGDEDQAMRHLETGIKLDERVGARPWAAHGQLELAQILRRRGDADEARLEATRAASTSQELRMSNLVRATSAFLKSLDGMQS
jgi:DNA-binding winged helix-turn-helix (wHTH) protein/tetratricopeptide (TPR) repeat protein